MANGEEIGRAHNTRWKENVVSALAYMLQMYVMQMMNRRANSTSLFSPFFSLSRVSYLGVREDRLNSARCSPHTEIIESINSALVSPAQRFSTPTGHFCPCFHGDETRVRPALHVNAAGDQVSPPPAGSQMLSSTREGILPTQRHSKKMVSDYTCNRP